MPDKSTVTTPITMRECLEWLEQEDRLYGKYQRQVKAVIAQLKAGAECAAALDSAFSSYNEKKALEAIGSARNSGLLEVK